MEQHHKKPSLIPGITAFCCVVTGIIGVVVSIISILDTNDYADAGFLLIASALAFGLLANAVFRN
jgi:hypothetical protein